MKKGLFLVCLGIFLALGAGSSALRGFNGSAEVIAFLIHGGLGVLAIVYGLKINK